MNCVICGNGDTKPGKATVTLERDKFTLVIRGVPARVCENCGEEYIEEREAERILAEAEETLQTGVDVEVRDYVAA